MYKYLVGGSKKDTVSSWWYPVKEEATGTNDKDRKSHFYSEGGQTLDKAAHRGSSISILEDIQNILGQAVTICSGWPCLSGALD